jgi:hypothetical protein
MWNQNNFKKEKIYSIKKTLVLIYGKKNGLKYSIIYIKFKK